MSAATFNVDIRPQSPHGAWHALTPQKRPRIGDAAGELGVSEAQLLAPGVGEHVVRPAGDLRELTTRMDESARAMALTRTDASAQSGWRTPTETLERR